MSDGKRTLVEIKARCADPHRVRAALQALDHRFVGEDHQIDTYYAGVDGRLKLREGSIEHTLIHYNRPNQSGPKRSDVQLYKPGGEGDLKAVLSHALEVLVVVDKRREIYFVDNVKFHIDRVEGLGSFLEIEAIDKGGVRTEEDLLAQCTHFMQVLGVRDEDLVEASYSDLLLRQGSDTARPVGAPARPEGAVLPDEAEDAHALEESVVTVWRIKMGIFVAVASIGVLIWDVLHFFDDDRALMFGTVPAAVLVGLGCLVWFGTRWRYRYWRFALRPDELFLERGVFNRVRTIVPLKRIQHIDVSQDVLEREFDLGKLMVHTAGTRSSDVVLPGLHIDEAERLRDRMKSFIMDEAL